MEGESAERAKVLALPLGFQAVPIVQSAQAN
jgi:hypothetical protein